MTSNFAPCYISTWFYRYGDITSELTGERIVLWYKLATNERIFCEKEIIEQSADEHRTKFFLHFPDELPTEDIFLWKTVAKITSVMPEQAKHGHKLWRRIISRWWIRHRLRWMTLTGSIVFDVESRYYTESKCSRGRVCSSWDTSQPADEICRDKERQLPRKMA